MWSHVGLLLGVLDNESIIMTTPHVRFAIVLVTGQSIGITDHYLIGTEKIRWNLGGKNKKEYNFTIENWTQSGELNKDLSSHSLIWFVKYPPQSDFLIYLTKLQYWLTN